MTQPIEADGTCYLRLREPPESRRLVQACAAIGDVERLLERRGDRDPLSIDDRDVDRWGAD